MMIFFDFAAAFPSVALSWIWQVLAAMSLLPGVVNFIEGIYYMNASFVAQQDGLHFFCWITAGVLQGCPLSGLIFVLIVDPLLRAIAETCDRPKLSMTRACADDIGTVLFNCRVLPLLHDLFYTIELCANLKLKPKKCNIIPLWGAFTLHKATCIRDFIARTVPHWHAFNILACAKYLGFWLGPAATLDMNWRGPMSKWKSKVFQLFPQAWRPQFARCSITGVRSPL